MTAKKLADRAKALADKKKQAAARQPDRKGRSVGKLFGGGAPAVTTGPLGDEGVSLLKAMAYVGGRIGRESCKSMVDMSDRLKATYGAFYPFENTPNSLLVPASAAYLPTHTGNGHEIPGAVRLKAELGERLRAGVDGYDPDEVRWVRNKALNTLSETAGGALVPPPSLGDLIDLQRNQEVFSQAGASNIDLPPSGRMHLPKLTGGSTAYWVGETGTATDSQQTTGNLALEARKLAVRTPLTNEMMRFASASVEGMVRTDMAAQGALKADLAMLEGTGGTQIKGLLTYDTAAAWVQGEDKLLAYTSTGTPANGNSGYPFQPEDIAAMDALLPDKVEPTAWVMRKQMFATLINRRADAVTAADAKGAFVFDRDRTAADQQQPTWYGRKVVKSSQVSKTRTRGSGAAFTYILTGYFPDWIIGRLGMFEFMVDPYTQMAQYSTVIQCVMFMDAGPRHASSFVLCDQLALT